MDFSWHQDSGYVKFMDSGTTHRPYLTCWCTLDAVDEANGTVYLMPHSRGGTANRIIDHDRDPETNDLVRYAGDDPGIAIEAPAGSVVAFSSYTFTAAAPTARTACAASTCHNTLPPRSVARKRANASIWPCRSSRKGATSTIT